MEEQILICASSPQIFKTTLEEVHVWKSTGYLSIGSTLFELGLVETIANLLKHPWSAKNDSLDWSVSFCGQTEEILVGS